MKRSERRKHTLHSSRGRKAKPPKRVLRRNVPLWPHSWPICLTCNREIYREIGLTYYGSGTRMEHDFVVHPGLIPLRSTLASTAHAMCRSGMTAICGSVWRAL